MNCQIDSLMTDVGMPCGKTAVAKCGDCGSAICDGLLHGMLWRFFLRIVLRLPPDECLPEEACSGWTQYVSGTRVI